MEHVGFDARIYTAAKIVVLLDALAEEKISSEHVLRGTDIAAETLFAVETKVSINQLLTCCRNALSLTHNRQLSFKVGSRFHLSSYGMYGYAMLSSPDFRRTMDFAIRYHPLASPLTTISLEETAHWAIWTINPIPHPKSDANLYRFQTEMQIATHLNLHRDLMGPDFVASHISFMYPRPPDFQLPSEFADCLIRFDQPANQLVFNSKWLDQPARLGNRITYPLVVEVCQNLLSDMRRRAGVAGRVRKILVADIAEHPSLEGVAKRLRISTRTLRRKLEQEGTSYRQLLEELRLHIAAKYLLETEMSLEDIGVALGYSDASNFRHAFREWTSRTPTQFRRGSVAEGADTPSE